MPINDGKYGCQFVSTLVQTALNELEQTYLPPFQAAVDAGVQSAMESYQEVNGEPVVGSAALLQGLLRKMLQKLLSRAWGFSVTRFDYKGA